MPRNLIASDATIRALKARRLSADEGHYLITIPSGSRAWRFDYRNAGKDRTANMGSNPDVGLDQAHRAVRPTRLSTKLAPRWFRAVGLPHLKNR